MFHFTSQLREKVLLAIQRELRCELDVKACGYAQRSVFPITIMRTLRCSNLIPIEFGSHALMVRHHRDARRIAPKPIV
jgi:hypothetical protein